MQALIQLFHQHPYTSSWFVLMVISAFVGAFPAPTKDSSTVYVVWFKFSNTVVGNLQRAASTQLEKSPNWQAAVQVAIDKHVEENGH